MKPNSLKFNLRRIRLDSGGYANKGRDYYGIGKPLYRAYCDDLVGLDIKSEPIEFEFRANNREHAKAIVKANYPNARFYN